MDDRELIETWLRSKSKLTKISYRFTVEDFIVEIRKPLAEVTLADLQKWQEKLLEKYKGNTVQFKTKLIKSLFAFGHELDYFSSNTGKLLKIPRIKNTLSERILSKEEVKQLIAATGCDRDRLLLTLIYACGLRVSEACGLTWSDLRSFGMSGKLTIFGKGSKTRHLVVPAFIWQELMAQKERSRSEYLFVSSRGNKLDRRRVHDIIKRVSKEAGLNPKLSTHWLRHSHGTHSLQAGCDIYLLKESFGHSSLTTTEKYLHVNPNTSSSDFIFF